MRGGGRDCVATRVKAYLPRWTLGYLFPVWYPAELLCKPNQSPGLEEHEPVDAIVRASKVKSPGHSCEQPNHLSNTPILHLAIRTYGNRARSHQARLGHVLLSECPRLSRHSAPFWPDDGMSSHLNAIPPMRYIPTLPFRSRCQMPHYVIQQNPSQTMHAYAWRRLGGKPHATRLLRGTQQNSNAEWRRPVSRAVESREPSLYVWSVCHLS